MAESSKNNGRKRTPSTTIIKVGANEMGKLPPQAPELEDSVLGALMLEKDAYGTVADLLRPEVFYKDQNRLVFEAIRALAAKDEPIDLLSVGEKLRSQGTLDKAGGVVYLSELTRRVASTAHLRYHAQIIANKATGRDLIALAAQIEEKGFDETQDVEELMQEAEAGIFEISQRSQKRDVTQIQYYNVESQSELFLHVGQGVIRLDNLREIVLPKRTWWQRMPFIGGGQPSAVKSQESEDKGKKVAEQPKEKGKKKPHAIVLTDDNLGKEYILSQCCHPIPGDEVLGYLAEDGKMYIHKIDCREANLLKTSYGKRIYSATWNTHRVQSFIETIELKGIDTFGLFIQVLQTITTAFHINIRSINVSSEDGLFQGRLEIYVYDRHELDELLKALRAIQEIKEVKRLIIEN